jgi:electron transport complex protein RnfE
MSDAVKTNYFRKFYNGIINENPLLIMILGLCPSLAVTYMVVNSLAMGISVIFVLLLSSFIISSLKNFIPERIKVISNILIIAVLTTIVEIILRAFFPFIYNSLGIFTGLIAVNCIILNCAEYAYKNKVLDAVVTSFGKGLGFTIVLIVISFFREILSTCQIDFTSAFQGADSLSFNYDKSSANIVIKNLFDFDIELYSSSLIFALSSGGFFVLGILIAIANLIKNKAKNK